ncbi:DrmE family protein [Paenibacillus massiliensis]|uniref:DrmE family protein n=1 Tax=Paenibacillus massiliensis TaxID=225917 RepID=UPI000362A1CA|nr:DrmE family protein [Paenibacillus massiliensis]
MFENIDSILRSVFAKTSFLIDEKYIEKSYLISRHVETIIGLLLKSQRERGLVLHQGTSIPLYLSVALACFKAYLTDNSDNAAFLNNLDIGDLVLYANKRGIYKGRDQNGNIIILNTDKGGTSTTNYVPISLVNKVQPYFGNGKVLDGRGIKRKRNISVAISELFEIKKQEVKNVINKSVLVVCDRFEADEICGKFGLIINKKLVKISELFPTAYITSNEVYHYPGNIAKVDPVIKFVNKLSFARELIIEDKSIETLIVSDSIYFTNGFSELVSIYERSTLKSIILLGEICKGLDSRFLNELENIQLYLWNKESLMAYEEFGIRLPEHLIHQESKRLQKMSSNHINMVEKVVQIDGFKHDGFFQCKKDLLQLCKQSDDSELRNIIVKKAYWLINLLEKSFFPISVMENMITKGQINAPSPYLELSAMRKYLNNCLGTNLEPLLRNIIESIARQVSELENHNPKFNYLLEEISDIKFTKTRLSIISAKTYYHKVFMEAAPMHLRELIEKVDFFTSNKYNSLILYDMVLVVGMQRFSQLNPFLLSNTESVSFILYENEIKRYHQAAEYTKNMLLSLQKRNLFVDNNNSFDASNTCEDIVSTDHELDENQIDDQLEILTESFSLTDSSENQVYFTNTGAQTSEVIRMALMETGEKIYFTRFYSVYIYNIDRQIVQEKDVYSLNEGDLLIFTSYDDDTRDIVERIIDILLESDNCSDQFREAYRKSKLWKGLLKDYIDRRKISYKQLSDMMEEMGAWKHEVTLRSWLDDASHIVGPRDIESYKTIAKITQDPEMLSSPEAYYQSSKEVRSMRVRVLKYLSKNIIKTYNKKDIHDEILSALPIDLTKMSKIFQIDRIVNTENLLVPSHLVNKPIII